MPPLALRVALTGRSMVVVVEDVEDGLRGLPIVDEVDAIRRRGDEPMPPLRDDVGVVMSGSSVSSSSSSTLSSSSGKMDAIFFAFLLTNRLAASSSSSSNKMVLEADTTRRTDVLRGWPGVGAGKGVFSTYLEVIVVVVVVVVVTFASLESIFFASLLCCPSGM